MNPFIFFLLLFLIFGIAWVIQSVQRARRGEALQEALTLFGQ